MEGGITFAVGAVFTAILGFMGGFDAWSSDLQGLLGALDSVTETKAEKEAPEVVNLVGSVSESMKSMSSWFKEESAVTDDMMVGTMPV